MHQAPLAAFLLGWLIRRLVCVSGLLVTVAFHARNAHFAILSLLTRTCGSGRLLRLAFSPTLVARLAMSSVASMTIAIIVGRLTPTGGTTRRTTVAAAMVISATLAAARVRIPPGLAATILTLRRCGTAGRGGCRGLAILPSCRHRQQENQRAVGTCHRERSCGEVYGRYA